MTTKQSYHLTENTLLTNKHVLLCHNVKPKDPALQEEFEYLKTNFCGQVYTDLDTFNPNFLAVNAILKLSLFLTSNITALNVPGNDLTKVNGRTCCISALSILSHFQLISYDFTPLCNGKDQVVMS